MHNEEGFMMMSLFGVYPCKCDQYDDDCGNNDDEQDRMSIDDVFGS